MISQSPGAGSTVDLRRHDHAVPGLIRSALLGLGISARGALLVAVALLREGLGVDVVAPDLPESSAVLRR